MYDCSRFWSAPTFFAEYSGRPDLHSFPTRRSSDLVPHQERAGLVPEERARPREGALGGDRSGAPSRGDRKSTRLNSSHSQTSYAVFCLKKKTQTVANG